MMSKEEILKYFKEKGIEVKISEEDRNAIEIKHCLLENHEKKWTAMVFKERAPNGKRIWFYMCFHSSTGNTLYTGIPLENIIYICDHDLDAIRNKFRS